MSPHLAGTAKERGYVAMHVAWLNREGANDRALAMLAAEWDYIIVTNNRRDFLRIHAQLDLHNGLIIIVPTVPADIVPTVPADEQCRLFDLAPDTVERQDSLINLLIEIRANRTMDVRNWSKGQWNQDRATGSARLTADQVVSLAEAYAWAAAYPSRQV